MTREELKAQRKADRAAPLVRWEELSEAAKQRLLTSGHPSNRPTAEDIASGRPIFRATGGGWICGYI